MQYSLNLYASNFYLDEEIKKLFGSYIFDNTFFRHFNFRKNLRFCTQCTKSFPTSDILKYHLRVHSERHFRCSLWDKSFKDSSWLRIHIRDHTGEKPFSCTLCPKSFVRHDSLKAHSRTHAWEKPFICTLCQMFFARPGYLKAYSRSHTGEKHLHLPIVWQILQGIIIKEKKKNIPLDQFKLDVAVSPLYMQANMLKQNAVTTRCIQDQIEKSKKKNRAVPVIRVIILMNFSRPPSLICLLCRLHQYKTLKCWWRRL